jgi:hypothetical protein
VHVFLSLQGIKEESRRPEMESESERQWQSVKYLSFSSFHFVFQRHTEHVSYIYTIGGAARIWKFVFFLVVNNVSLYF